MGSLLLLLKAKFIQQGSIRMTQLVFYEAVVHEARKNKNKNTRTVFAFEMLSDVDGN